MRKVLSPLQFVDVWIIQLSSHHCLSAGSSGGRESACSAGDLGSIPGLGRSPGEGDDNPLKYSCLENPMDRGAWWATVYRLAKSQTRLTDTDTHTHTHTHTHPPLMLVSVLPLLLSSSKWFSTLLPEQHFQKPDPASLLLIILQTCHSHKIKARSVTWLINALSTGPLLSLPFLLYLLSPRTSSALTIFPQWCPPKPQSLKGVSSGLSPSF